MSAIGNDRELRIALDGLTPQQQRVLGGRFVASVLALCEEESVDLVPLWQSRNPVWNALFQRYAYTFAHTVVPTSVPQRYSDVGGISAYSSSAQREEVELTRRQPNNIPRMIINYRDGGLDETTRKYIDELLSVKA